MRYVLAAALMAGFTMGAQAQETTPTPAAVAPSACPAVPEPPAPPNGARTSAEQMAAAVAQYEAWNTSATAPLQCRVQEVHALRAQTAARETEYNASLAMGRDAGAAWQAQVDAYQARQRR